MKYRLTCLTPTLVGDGNKLSPIDYMVWKDQVNVLDQQRIFTLLAKGPRLDGYLSQLRRADKLDFASWGGFAQNFADRRIPFEHPSMTAIWERSRSEFLFIPTFASTASGPYIPGTALKGALHTGYLFSRWSENFLKAIADEFRERPPRRPAETAERMGVGDPGHSRMRAVSISDSASAAAANFKVHLLRTSTLVAKGQGRLELGWKTSPRGSVEPRRVEESTALFCEMAVPGTVFEGSLRESAFLGGPEVGKALRWREAPDAKTLFGAANAYAGRLLEHHLQYAKTAGLAVLEKSLAELSGKLAEVKESGDGCLLSLGWGSGFLSKVSCLETESDAYRQILRQISLYQRDIQTGLPFPKTRKVVFLNNQPATLPGWVLLQTASPN